MIRDDITFDDMYVVCFDALMMLKWTTSSCVQNLNLMSDFLFCWFLAATDAAVHGWKVGAWSPALIVSACGKKDQNFNDEKSCREDKNWENWFKFILLCKNSKRIWRNGTINRLWFFPKKAFHSNNCNFIQEILLLCSIKKPFRLWNWCSFFFLCSKTLTKPKSFS